MLVNRFSIGLQSWFRTAFALSLLSSCLISNLLLAQSPPKLSLETVYSMAEERTIPKKVVDAARNFEQEFDKYGKEGFEAVCLLIETGHTSTRLQRLLEESYFEGSEEKLLDLCQREELPNYGMWLALRGLGVAKTPKVKKYLLERLKKERDPGFFMSAAEALGELEESSGIDVVGKQLLEFQDQWGGVERHLMSAMFNMDAAQAVPWLSKYLENEKSKQLYSAIYLIGRVEPELAQQKAKDLVNRRKDIDPTQLSLIRRYTK